MPARSLSRRTARIATVAGTMAGTAAILSTLGTGAASAAQVTTIALNPGDSACVQQYAGYQVHADGSATGGGARFKLLRNGAVLIATPGRVNSWSAELRTAYGNFPGPGYYAACAYNTGTARTTVYLNVRTDGEV